MIFRCWPPGSEERWSLRERRCVAAPAHRLQRVRPRAKDPKTSLWVSWVDKTDSRLWGGKEAKACGPEPRRGGKSTDTRSRDLKGSPLPSSAECWPVHLWSGSGDHPGQGGVGGRSRQYTPRSPTRPERVCAPRLPALDRLYHQQTSSTRKVKAMPQGEGKGCQTESWMYTRE